MVNDIPRPNLDMESSLNAVKNVKCPPSPPEQDMLGSLRRREIGEVRVGLEKMKRRSLGRDVGKDGRRIGGIGDGREIAREVSCPTPIPLFRLDSGESGWSQSRR